MRRSLERQETLLKHAINVQNPSHLNGSLAQQFKDEKFEKLIDERNSKYEQNEEKRIANEKMARREKVKVTE